MNVFSTSPAHRPAREARGQIAALAELLRSSSAAGLDRRGIAERLSRAIRALYAVLDTSVEAPAHQEGLDECVRILGEARGLLVVSANDATIAQAIAALDAARACVASAREAVVDITIAASGRHPRVEAPAPALRPFRASIALPQLHVLARAVIAPPISLDADSPVSAARPKRPPPPKPSSLEELRAAAAAKPAVPAPPAPDPAPAPRTQPASDDGELVRRVARDCLEDIAGLRALRKPIPTETWLDQAPFEQRLLENIDAFVALGARALPGVTLFHAEAPAPDPARGFAVALTLGCIEGTDTTDVAIATMKQSAPEELAGFAEGFVLAPSPAIDAELVALVDEPNPALAGLAIEVLGVRGTLPHDAAERALARNDRGLTTKLARALGQSVQKTKAIALLGEILEGGSANDDEIFALGCASLLRRGDGAVRQRLRDAVRSRPSRRTAAAALLAVSGRADDLELVLAALATPTPALVHAVARFGHVDTLPVLLPLLDHEDAALKSATAMALDFLTGAGLRETAEIPWPGAESPHGAPLKTRTVSRVITDRLPWESWYARMRGLLDPRVKLRHGRPFVPQMIIEELASNAPVEHRAEAIFELVVATGLGMRLSATDWVLRQKRALGELTDPSSGDATAGAWWFGGASLTSR